MFRSNMINSYNQRFYPNPFRYQKLNTTKNINSTFEKVQQLIKPFLNENFYLVDNYIDEFDKMQKEAKITRILRNKVKRGFKLIKTKFNIASEKSELINYQKNLRFLEFPLQPTTDKQGFETELLSSDLIEDVLEEIDEGFSYIYDYYSKSLPESVELWKDYASSTPSEFPIISHDNLLEASYEVFDKIFDDFQKSSINLFEWVVSGDVNSRVMKIIKPTIKSTKLLILLESLISFTILLLILQYILKDTELIKLIKNRNLSFHYIKKNTLRLKKKISLKKFQINQKMKKLNLKFTNFKTYCKYKTFKLLKTN